MLQQETYSTTWRLLNIRWHKEFCIPKLRWSRVIHSPTLFKCSLTIHNTRMHIWLHTILILYIAIIYLGMYRQYAHCKLNSIELHLLNTYWTPWQAESWHQRVKMHITLNCIKSALSITKHSGHDMCLNILIFQAHNAMWSSVMSPSLHSCI